MEKRIYLVLKFEEVYFGRYPRQIIHDVIGAYDSQEKADIALRAADVSNHGYTFQIVPKTIQ